ncbi:hypothetical protein GYMLUDRAFT_799766 [Collybiopsis luxurians FD-317 M1]|nr:hypothetical protein GYMLUDRAFT_799766 [Collybiopsis luxurians FD-317 M1]
MSSRAAAGRKRLQQPQPKKSSSFKASFIKNFSNDKKSPPSPTTLSTPTLQSYNPSGTSDIGDFNPAAPPPFTQPNSLPPPPQWHPQARSASNPARPRGYSESAGSNRKPPLSSYHDPTAPHSFYPYPSPPESVADIYTRGSSPSGSSIAQQMNATSTSPARTSPFIFRPDSPSGQIYSLRHDSAATSAHIVSSLGSSSHSKMGNRMHSNGYPSPPLSTSDNLSPLSLSPASAENPPLPSLVFSESSSEFTSSSNMSSSLSLAVNTPSIFSTSSGSGGSIKSADASLPKRSPGFVYPSSRSLGRPSPGGPKFKFKSKQVQESGTEADTENPDESYTYVQRRVGARTTPAGLRLSVAGPSSISTPSIISFNSSNSSTKSSNSDFVFPTTRSRAHPNAVPRKFRKKKDSPLDEVENGPTKFMGLSLNRKKRNSPNLQFPAVPEIPPSRHLETPTPTTAQFEGEYTYVQNEPAPVLRLPPKLGTYPLDPYNSAILESDRLSYNLLRRLNPTDTPSFCLYGNDPPSSVLDLGSGQGHWLLEAAIHWKGYGTQFTGLDIADTMKAIRPLALKHGVADNIKFVRSNFLKRPLPFEDETFDLVRMSDLTYAISYDKWDFILGEIYRVLTIGGRLEFIDDHVFFPYAKSLPPSFAPQPISDGQRSARERDNPVLYGYGADKEGEDSDTATLNGNRAGPSSLPTRFSPPQQITATMPPVEAQFWTEQSDAAQELETLFEHMMNRKFGIHLCPSEFISEMMTQIFGHAREVKTMHLTIAPPDAQLFASSDGKEPSMTMSNANARPSTSRQTDSLNASLDNPEDHRSINSPGLVLWPSTLLPMSSAELMAHALKHPKTLLSCKAALSEYAAETLDIEAEDDMVMEALWEYEGFFNSRLTSPSPAAETTVLPASASSTSVNTEREFRTHRRGPERSSIYSTSSITSEARSAMWDYDFELRHHFAWPLESPTAGQNPSAGRTDNGSSSSPGVSPPPRTGEIRRRSASSDTGTITSSLPSFTTNAPSVARKPLERESMPPDYSATEPTHVRTFHVYEALKIEPGLLSPISPV